MPSSIEYDRKAAAKYASRWAYGRNPKYYDFDGLGGDCTNFASQCIFAGSGVMNFTPITGWYFVNINKRSASWSSVIYLYKFLTTNKGAGPYAQTVQPQSVMTGDLIQLKRGSIFTHSLIVTEVTDNDFLIACHTMDSLNRPLSTYSYDDIRYVHILGVRR